MIVKGSVSCRDVFLIQSLFCTIGRKQAERSQTRWVQRGHKGYEHRQNADMCSTGKLKKSKGMRLQQEHFSVFSVCQNVWDIKRHYIYNGFIQRIATKALSQCLSGVHIYVPHLIHRFGLEIPVWPIASYLPSASWYVMESNILNNTQITHHISTAAFRNKSVLLLFFLILPKHWSHKNTLKFKWFCFFSIFNNFLEPE